MIFDVVMNDDPFSCTDTCRWRSDLNVTPLSGVRTAAKATTTYTLNLFNHRRSIVTA